MGSETEPKTQCPKTYSYRAASGSPRDWTQHEVLRCVCFNELVCDGFILSSELEMLPMESVPAFSMSPIIPPTDPWVNQSQVEGNYKICKMIEGRKTLIFKTCPYEKLRVYKTQRSNVSVLKGCIYLLNIQAFF